jgi:hypothetical protein
MYASGISVHEGIVTGNVVDGTGSEAVVIEGVGSVAEVVDSVVDGTGSVAVVIEGVGSVAEVVDSGTDVERVADEETVMSVHVSPVYPLPFSWHVFWHHLFVVQSSLY